MKNVRNVTRLRTAYQAAKLLCSREKPQVVQSWFMRLNPDRSAATLLREGDIQVAGPALMRAARTFISALMRRKMESVHTVPGTRVFRVRWRTAVGNRV